MRRLIAAMLAGASVMALSIAAGDDLYFVV
jgi:hypothetical protein